MAYQLQPDLVNVLSPVVPDARADTQFFSYPQSTHDNYCCRPNTMLYGTAPYMAGKGAPANYILISDELRPQSTSQFNKIVIKTHERNLFPLQDMSCALPQRAMKYEPTSTRADVQNALFDIRYNKK